MLGARTTGTAPYDIIGDIHGHFDVLEGLLELLGYEDDGNCYRHSTRKVIFVGDLIDRGPKIRETLELVKAMVDHDQALITLGNHEYNAVCYCSQNEEGEWLRPHSKKNQHQFQATRDAFAEDEATWQQYLDWFRTLPLYLDMGEFRVTHACWSQRHIDLIGDRRLSDRDFLLKSAQHGTVEFGAVEIVLKGPEMELPGGMTISDKEGNVRTEIRTKWWVPLEGASYRTIAFPENLDLPDLPIDVSENCDPWDIYQSDAPPVFIGHYWLPPQPPVPFQNIVCLDYSVAKGGFLTGYRWNPGDDISANSFVRMNHVSSADR